MFKLNILIRLLRDTNCIYNASAAGKNGYNCRKIVVYQHFLIYQAVSHIVFKYLSNEIIAIIYLKNFDRLFCNNLLENNINKSKLLLLAQYKKYFRFASSQLLKTFQHYPICLMN